MNVFAHDVFISYRQREPDKSWVQDILVPYLDGQGFDVFVDYRSFRLGAHLITEMLEGIETSRYTIAIFTPLYLKSGFTEFESLMAEHLGIEESQRKLIVVMRKKCKPQLNIRAKLWLDMSDDMKFAETSLKLAKQLRLRTSV
jgi:hypothetical protein